MAGSKIKRLFLQSSRRYKTTFEDFFNNALEDYVDNLTYAQKISGALSDAEVVIDVSLQIKDMLAKNEFIIKNAFFQYCLKSTVGDKVKNAIKGIKNTHWFLKQFNSYVKGTKYEDIDKKLSDLDKVFNVEINTSLLSQLTLSLTNNVTATAESLAKEDSDKTFLEKLKTMKTMVPTSQEELENFIIEAPKHIVENIEQFVNDPKSGVIIKQIFDNPTKFNILKADLEHESERFLSMAKAEYAEVKYNLYENVQFSDLPSLLPPYPQPLYTITDSAPRYKVSQKQDASILLSINRVNVIVLYVFCLLFITLFYKGKKKREAKRYLLTTGAVEVLDSLS